MRPQQGVPARHLVGPHQAHLRLAQRDLAVPHSRTTITRDTSWSYSKPKNTRRTVAGILLKSADEHGEAEGKCRHYAVESDQRPGKSSAQPGPRAARLERTDVHREVDLAVLQLSDVVV